MKLVITFSDRSASFTNGVEFGRMLEKMERGEPVIQNNGFPIHSDNITVIKSSCDQYGYVPLFGDSGVDGWTNFIGVKKVASDN